MSLADLSACLEVYYESLDELHIRVGQPVDERFPELMVRLLGVILGSDPSTSWVAESAGRVVAFGQGVRRGDLAHLAFLFVRPGDQGKGLGRAVLERCLPGAATSSPGERPGLRMSVAVEAIQPISTALYASYGMLPRVPIHTLVGSIRPDGLPNLPAGLTARPLAPMAVEGLEAAALAAAVMAVDHAAYGFARLGDHAVARQMGRTGYLFEDAIGAVRGYGYVSDAGRLAPTIVDDPALLPGVLGYLVRTCDPTTSWNVGLPGPSAAFRELIAAGLRIEGPPVIYCATWPGPPYQRIVPTGFAMP